MFVSYHGNRAVIIQQSMNRKQTNKASIFSYLPLIDVELNQDLRQQHHPGEDGQTADQL